ncbi:flavodoxin domain-containing protein [Williamsia sp. 1135]|uniref:flavodoxin domain-containing protein n=1 Tax=Williamsia sp. 1135 TaxID=1889262 RepID=UPI001F0B54A9|nr:flavodoxin domain-containing protein [Williamsia sp. 1135]
MIKVLVATASRHGSTREIGEQLGTALSAGLLVREVDAEVEVLDADQIESLADVDALILGSAVYMGRWLKSARSLVDRETERLESIPVWLFSSGPVDDNGKTDGGKATPEVKIASAAWAQDHHTFGGKLDRAELSWGERLVASAVHATDGDHRSSSEIGEWADEICGSLAEMSIVRNDW